MLTPISTGGGGEVITYTRTPPPSVMGEGGVPKLCAIFSKPGPVEATFLFFRNNTPPLELPVPTVVASSFGLCLRR